MALQLSGSIDVIGGFNTTQGGTYSGSGFYEDIFLSGSVYDGSFKLGDPETILAIDENGKAKWEEKQNISDISNDPAVKQRDFNYYINWEGGLDFSASAASIPIVGDSYYIEETVINLSSADATFARFDIIVATTGSNNTGSFEVVEGTPAQSPFYPAYDENKSIALKYILVRAAATDAAAGGDGTADNDDGSNNTDGDDGDDGDGTGGDPYRNFQNRVLWNSYNAADQWVNQIYNDSLRPIRTKTFVSRAQNLINRSSPLEPLEGNAVIEIKAYESKTYSTISYGAAVRAGNIRARSWYNHTINNGSFHLSDLNNISFYIKPTIPFPNDYLGFIVVNLVPRSGMANDHFYQGQRLLTPEYINFQSTTFQKLTFNGDEFQKHERNQNGITEDIVAVQLMYRAAQRKGDGSLTALNTVMGNPSYIITLDKIVAQLGSGTPAEIPTAKASNSKLPPFNATYGSPTIKNLKLNSKGTKLIGNYSNILGGSNNIITGSSTVTSSIFSGTTGSFQVVNGPEYSSIVGGYENFISGSITGSVILGGFNNKVDSNFSTVIGGQNNTSSFDNTFIIGCNLTADKVAYTFVNNIDIQGTASASIFSGSFVGDGTGLTGITASPAGTDTQVQYNNSGVLGASSNFTYDGTTLNLAYTGTNDLLRLTSTDGGAASAPDLTFCRNSASPADQDTLGVIQFFGQSDFPACKNYASIFSRIGCATAGQTRGNLLFKADRCNAFINTLTISPEGLYVLPPSDTAETGAGIGLTVNGTISGSSDLIIEGTVSASTFSGSFVGDGSGLTGISGGSGGSGDYSPFISGSTFSTGILPREGDNCTTVGGNATIAGGTKNTGSGQCTFIGAGECNYASTTRATVVAGCNNEALSPNSAVVGGESNSACANHTFIGSGRLNTVCGWTGGITSGACNCISSAVNYAIIGGGVRNTGSAHCSGILGGANNYISGSHNDSFIIGSNITSSAACTTFVNNFKAQGPSAGTTVVILENLPSSDPGVPGQLYRSGGDLKISI